MTSNLREKYGSFKSITDNIENAKVSPEFWKKEKENIRKGNEETRKWKKAMKMTFEKYHQEFNI